MHWLLTWQFWAILHIVILVPSAALAIYWRKWWTAALVTAGALLGAVLAVLPLWYSMQRYTEETGFDAGNAGVFFCCTVPIFPLIGIVVGAIIGSALDPGN